MNKTLRISVIILLSAMLAGLIAEPTYAQSPVRKLGRGLANTFFGILEFPKAIVDVNEEDGALGAITYGVAKGMALAFLRTGIGIYETVTFLVPLPWRYEPIIEPEFMMSDAD